MALYKETSGTGPDIVLLHGWGLHGGVFDPVIGRLAKRHRVTRIDLPGHGRSRDVLPQGGLDGWVEALAAVAPPRAVWLGWSLGGMLALRLARQLPARVHGLLLCCTTPKFVAAPDWPPAQQAATLARFAADLRQDYRATVQQFLALQVQGDDCARAVLRDLRARVFAHGDPHPDGLAGGLAILRDTDLRKALPDIAVPARVIMGQHDRLTPPAAGEYLVRQLPRAQYHVVPRAAHAPFLSHPDEFLQHTQTFLEQLND